jgi:hypothetical protein
VTHDAEHTAPITPTLVSGRIFILPTLQKHEKVSRSTLLEQAHQAAPQRLALIGGDLVNLAIPVDVGTGDLLEFEVSNDVGVDEHSGKVAACQDELGDEVDGVVSITSEGVGGRAVAEFLVELGGRSWMGIISWANLSHAHLSQVQTGRGSSVVVLSIHVQDLFPALAEESTEDTFGEACALWWGRTRV